MEAAMNTNVTNSISQRSRIHPLIAGAAVSVILACATGVAAMTGILPVSHAVPSPNVQIGAATVQPASVPLAAQQSNAAQPAVQPAVQTVAQQKKWD
jgi:hypothetical protein